MRGSTKNLGAGFLYFYIHFVTEVICFFVLGRYAGSSINLWVIMLTYDMLAFVPQAFIGYVSDRFKKIPFGVIGLLLLALSVFLFAYVKNPFVSLIVMCLGNCCTHVNGAEVTLRASGGKLSHSAIFVAGGSFGVITGKILADTAMPLWPLAALAILAVPLAVLAQFYISAAQEKSEVPCKPFNYSKKAACAAAVILLTVFIVAVRGYMGYGIPTSWKKTLWQTALLFVTMGIGKAAGGIFADIFGARKTALVSSVAALPFLMLGDRYIVVSLIGVMLFSMTMSITLGILVSVMPQSPGLAFGLTTTGLFIGTVPIFFFKLGTVVANCIMIGVLTVLCAACFLAVMRKDGANG